MNSEWRHFICHLYGQDELVGIWNCVAALRVGNKSEMKNQMYNINMDDSRSTE